MTAAEKLPLIIGHRGASAVAPENTLAAFDRALTEGADGIELDVRLSRDGVPAVIHDATLKRTANRRDPVSSLTADALARVEVGSWFNRRFRARAREEYAGERLPTLDRLFAAMRDKRALLYVELKSDGVVDERLAASVAELVATYELWHRVIVESFTLKNLGSIKRADSRIKTAALFEPKAEPVSLVRPLRSVNRALSVGADEIALHRSVVNQRVVAAAHDAGLAVVVWTVDKPSWVDRAHRLGIEALITNRPAEMLQARAAMTD